MSTIQQDVGPQSPIERAAYVMARLSKGEQLRTADVAVACGLTRQGAYRLLDIMSRVTPLILDSGYWSLLEASEPGSQPSSD